MKKSSVGSEGVPLSSQVILVKPEAEILQVPEQVSGAVTVSAKVQVPSASSWMVMDRLPAPAVPEVVVKVVVLP